MRSTFFPPKLVFDRLRKKRKLPCQYILKDALVCNSKKKPFVVASTDTLNDLDIMIRKRFRYSIQTHCNEFNLEGHPLNGDLIISPFDFAEHQSMPVSDLNLHEGDFIEYNYNIIYLKRHVFMVVEIIVD